MFYNKLTACNKAKGAGEWRRRRGGQQFLHRLPVLNHTTREWKREERGKVEERNRFSFSLKKKTNNKLLQDIFFCIYSLSALMKRSKVKQVVYCSWGSELKCIKSYWHCAVIITQAGVQDCTCCDFTGRGQCWNSQDNTCDISGRWREIFATATAMTWLICWLLVKNKAHKNIYCYYTNKPYFCNNMCMFL